MIWKWIVAELVGERNEQHWQRREEEFATQSEAEAWIGQQADPSRFEVREIAEGSA